MNADLRSVSHNDSMTTDHFRHYGTIRNKHHTPKHTWGCRLNADATSIDKSSFANARWIEMSPVGVGLDLRKNARTHSKDIHHFLIKLHGKGPSCVPKVCAEIGLYRGGIITKPCLINENMTQVSELIYQQATVSHQRVAAELGGISWKMVYKHRQKNFPGMSFKLNSFNLKLKRFAGIQTRMGKVEKGINQLYIVALL